MQAFSTKLEPIETQWCECTVDYGPDGISGSQTKMNYLGDAKFKCPNCNHIEDMQSDTYKVRLQFKKSKGCEDCGDDGKDCGDKDCKAYMTVKILEPIFDKRLLKKWDKECTGSIKDALEDDLGAWDSEEGFFHLGKHPEGVFDVELLYNYYRCSHEYEEYDMNLRIIAESLVTDKTEP